jgi:hypothetical protein
MDFVENVGRRSRAAGDTGDFIDVGAFSLNGYERDALYRNLGNGRFADVGYLEGADRIEDGRGLGMLDIDGDGDLDLILENYAQPARLLVNHAPPENHWLRLRLRGTRSNRWGVGARAVIHHGAHKQTREVSTTAGYLSGQSTYLHYGLGLDRSIDVVTVHWPSGAVDEIRELPGDRFYEIVEGSGSAVPLFPPRVEDDVSPAALKEPPASAPSGGAVAPPR